MKAAFYRVPWVLVLCLAIFAVFPGWPAASIVCLVIVSESAIRASKQTSEMLAEVKGVDAAKVIQAQADVCKRLDDFEHVLKGISLSKAMGR